VERSLNFIIVDDHAVVRAGLKHILLEAFPDAKFKEASNASRAFKYVLQADFDLLISDISMPGVSGLELLKKIKSVKPELRVLFLSIHSEELYAIRALKSGASGYLTKDNIPEELVVAVRRILQGKKYVSANMAIIMADLLEKGSKLELHEILSDRELEVFKLIAKGKSISEIAQLILLSPNSISTYRSRILSKTGLKNNAEIVQYIIKNKLFE